MTEDIAQPTSKAEAGQSDANAPQSHTPNALMSPQQLIERNICPVKRDYVLTSIKRVLVEAVSSSANEHQPVEKQSRKKQKKERQQVGILGTPSATHHPLAGSPGSHVPRIRRRQLLLWRRVQVFTRRGKVPDRQATRPPRNLPIHGCGCAMQTRCEYNTQLMCNTCPHDCAANPYILRLAVSICIHPHPPC